MRSGSRGMRTTIQKLGSAIVQDDDGDGEERVPRSPTPVSSTGRPDERKRGKEKLKREGEVEAMKKKDR